MRLGRSPAWAIACGALVLSTLDVASAGGQAARAIRGASVSGLVTTQNGTVILPGATVTLRRAGGQSVGTAVTAGDGRFQFPGLQAGDWELDVSLAGFLTDRRTVTLAADAAADLAIDLPLQPVTEQVEVAERRQATSLAESLAPRDTLEAAFLERSVLIGDTLGGVVAGMPGVIVTRSGLSIRGGRPVQSRTLVDASVMEDPFTGMAPLKLPVDAIASVDVMPTPYAVEYGGFSSGVTQVTTRQGTGTWRATLNNLDPSFRGRRGRFGVLGVRSFAPRFGLGGPIVKERLFIAESLQYRHTVEDVMSRPEGEVATQDYLSAVTRVDAVASAGHSLIASLSLFPETRTAVNLDTFNPPPVAFNQRNRVSLASLTDHLVLSSNLLLTGTLSLGRYSVRTYPAAEAPMTIGVDGNGGNYFSTQDRRSRALQWTEALSLFTRGVSGEHLAKVGVDVVNGSAISSSLSRPIEVVRADGTRASETRFLPAAGQRVDATSVGVFVQDRWQPVRRLIVEAGVRLDRDGVLRRTNLAPRAAVALALDDSRSMTIRAGAGVFCERSPLNARVFDQLETRVVTRYAADGTTPLASPVAWVHTTAPWLETPRSAAWNVAFDWQIPRAVSLHAGHLERDGRSDLIVDLRDAPGFEALVLSSLGRSRYVETEAEVAWTRGASDVRLTYVRSSSAGDLNAHSLLYGSAPEPLVRANEYGPSSSDVPHRLVARAQAPLRRVWFLQAALERRSGFPYSTVDEEQAFVGPRNRAGRFPAATLVDAAIERQVKVARWRPWFGLRVSNLFNAFAPLDVQANVASPAFGQFYNAVPRRYSFIVRLHR